ncbi:MAG: DUF4387 domain-containing protein [Clostridiales bacterium]|nr:DUF4387 domain-containing protein [Clostridiales bacterium]
MHMTFDIVFSEKSIMEQIEKSGVLNKRKIAEVYDVYETDVEIIYYETVNAIKITIPRKDVSGSIYDSDIYGCQQHLPLANIEVPL